MVHKMLLRAKTPQKHESETWNRF